MLDLQHGAFIRLVDAGTRLGHNAIQSCSLKTTEPVLGYAGVAGDGREMNGGRCGRECFLEQRAPMLERLLHQVFVTERKEVEKDNGSRSLLREQADP